MTIDPATLNRRLTIVRRTVVPNEEYGDTFDWNDLRTVWAGMKYDQADEVFAANQGYAVRVVTFTIRFTSDLTALDRVRCLGVTYDVTGLKEIGNRLGLEIKAEAMNPGGA
ncbi:phage head closure protein [Hoeflea sp.]|uniref:phage head closure protein n=1 Tax=Hoeflea sp. TaxID=1940281 RepID=UPI003B51C275